jgi:hypothetical protein
VAAKKRKESKEVTGWARASLFSACHAWKDCPKQPEFWPKKGKELKNQNFGSGFFLLSLLSASQAWKYCPKQPESWPKKGKVMKNQNFGSGFFLLSLFSASRFRSPPPSQLLWLQGGLVLIRKLWASTAEG